MLLVQPKDMFEVEPESWILVLGLQLQCVRKTLYKGSVSSSPDKVIRLFGESNDNTSHESIVPLTVRYKEELEDAWMLQISFKQEMNDNFSFSFIFRKSGDTKNSTHHNRCLCGVGCNCSPRISIVSSWEEVLSEVGVGLNSSFLSKPFSLQNDYTALP